MDEKDTQQAAAAQDGGIEKLLAHRRQIDEQLKAQYSQNTTVMFTDIKGSTSFFETYTIALTIWLTQNILVHQVFSQVHRITHAHS